MNNWIDISMLDQDGMVNWPGDGRVEIKQVMSMADGAACNVTRLNMSVHTGTHMDAPRHFVANGAGMDTWPPDSTIGACRIIEIQDPVSITAAELAQHLPQRGERILFKTRNSAERRLEDPEFYEPFVYIAEDAALLLVEAGVRTVGVDYLSVGGFYKDGIETHVALLGAGIWVIEGLKLTGLTPGPYELNCMPLNIKGSDGAPARALLRSIPTNL